MHHIQWKWKLWQKKNMEALSIHPFFPSPDGYISNTCVDVDYEEIKRKILSKAAPPALLDEDVYDDVGADPLNR